jgi:hypothetical protein
MKGQRSEKDEGRNPGGAAAGRMQCRIRRTGGFQLVEVLVALGLIVSTLGVMSCSSDRPRPSGNRAGK